MYRVFIKYCVRNLNFGLLPFSVFTTLRNKNTVVNEHPVCCEIFIRAKVHIFLYLIFTTVD